jgi:hypothetical protein
MSVSRRFKTIFGSCAATVLVLGNAYAHCDHVDGPVVTEAQHALATGDITPLLKWVMPEDEAALRQAFKQTLEVRGESAAARELADRYFFETLVRIHRASEGAPYTGLKPAGSPVPPAIEAADKAVAQDSADALVAAVTDEVERELRDRFEALQAAKAHKDESVEAGRKYVETYVTFVHYVKGLHESIEGEDGHGSARSHGATAGDHAHR